MQNFISGFQGYEDLVKDNQILLDCDAIISLSEYGATDVLDEFKKLNTTCWIIDPVYLELYCTDNSVKRASRISLITNYDIGTLPFFKDKASTKNSLVYANKVQAWLVSQRIFTASPTDLYLAGTLATYKDSSTKLFLLTANLSDFPDPLFKRESYLVLQNTKSSKLLAFLSFDSTVLDSISA